jgi:hypothetical protein
MLLALLQNNQNVIPVQPVLPKVIIDRGGGGQVYPWFDIVDIHASLSSFIEISGEDPVVRAKRRHEHIRDTVGVIRDRRERREGAAFLAGATLAESAAQERIDELLREIDTMRLRETCAAMTPIAAPVRTPMRRGNYAAASSSGSSGIMGPLLLVAGGVALGIMIARRKPGARSR